MRGLVKLNLKRNNPIPPAVQEALDKFEEEYGYEVPVPKGFGRNVQPKSPPGGPRQRPKRELTRRKRRPTSGSTSEEEEEPTAKAAAAAEEAAAQGAEPIALLPEVAAAAKSAGRVISVALATQEAALRRVRAGKATPEPVGQQLPPEERGNRSENCREQSTGSGNSRSCRRGSDQGPGVGP